MKLTSINIIGYLAIKHLELKLTRPIQLICGENGVGKSAVRDGLELAMTGNLSRIELRKDAAELVHDDAKASACGVTELLESGDERIYGTTITRSGKIVETREVQPDAALECVLNAQRFADMDEKARRKFLFKLMRISLTPAAISERLLARGLDATKVDIVKTMLTNGFDAGAEDARTRATQAKGSWRVVTGETYGAVKAVKWAAQMPEGDPSLEDPSLLAATIDQLRLLDDKIAAANQAVGAIRQKRQAHAEAQAKLPELRERAADIDRIKAKLEVDRQNLADVQAKVDNAKAAAAPAKIQAGTTALACPCCAAMLTMRDGKLVEWVAPTALETDAEALALPGYLRSLEMCQRTVANTERSLAEAESAQREAKLLEEMPELDAAEAEGLAKAAAEVAVLEERRKKAEWTRDACKAARDAVAAAEKKTADAAKYHADVTQWEAIAEALGPNGIQAEVLAAALAPLNKRMEQSSVDACWPVVSMGDDMMLRFGGRPYYIISKSQQWRVKAVFAEAVSHISGKKLLVLDEMDILQISARSQLLGWLDTIVRLGELDTAIVCATLKGRPAGMLNTIQVTWIADGVAAAE